MIFRILALGACAIACSVASANQHSYVGVSFSQVAYQESGLDELNPTALTVRFGAQLNENFAVEARLGKGLSDDEMDIDIMGMAGTASVEADQLIGAYGRLILPVNERFSVYAMMGLTRAKATFKVAVPGIGSSSGSDSETELSYGLGADLLISPKVFATLEYAFLHSEDDYDLDALSVGLGVRF